MKATLDVAASKQAELEKQIASLSTGVNLSEAAQVKLTALEREAAANREIYQQFLSRNKQTVELALLVEDNVRIVSEAVPPLRPVRPSLALAGPALAFLSIAIAAAAAVGRDFGSVVKIDRDAPPARGQPGRRRGARRPAAVQAQQSEKPIARPFAPQPLSLLHAWTRPDADPKLGQAGARTEKYRPLAPIPFLFQSRES